jgi:hypothetical protein
MQVKHIVGYPLVGLAGAAAVKGSEALYPTACTLVFVPATNKARDALSSAASGFTSLSWAIPAWLDRLIFYGYVTIMIALLLLVASKGFARLMKWLLDMRHTHPYAAKYGRFVWFWSLVGKMGSIRFPKVSWLKIKWPKMRRNKPKNYGKRQPAFLSAPYTYNDNRAALEQPHYQAPPMGSAPIVSSGFRPLETQGQGSSWRDSKSVDSSFGYSAPQRTCPECHRPLPL